MKNKEFSNILCKRIQTLRIKHGYTMEQLAYQSGISKGGLSEIERCMKEPMPLTILKICIGLNITMKEFFDFKEMEEFATKL